MLTIKNKIINTVVTYSFLFVIGISAGYGVMLGYKYFTAPNIVVIGDYTKHFEGTERRVIMYGTDWCPVCKRARDFFSDEGIAFKEFNPEKDESAFEMYSELEANGYPVIIIGNKRIFGLDIKEIKLALNEF